VLKANNLTAIFIVGVCILLHVLLNHKIKYSFSMITCFDLHKRPSSGDFFVTQNIKKRVTICCNGSVESDGKIICKIAVVKVKIQEIKIKLGYNYK
jgi:hypothetical protein